MIPTRSTSVMAVSLAPSELMLAVESAIQFCSWVNGRDGGTQRDANNNGDMLMYVVFWCTLAINYCSTCV